MLHVPMIDFRCVRSSLALTLLLCPAAWVGCGSSSLPPPSEPDQARSVLTAALDAWKRGEPPGSLADASPPVRVIDREWEEGATLDDYTLEGQGHPLGLNIRQAVTLQMTTPQGRAVKKTVHYLVSGGATPVVAREDIDE